jgi:CheY-like chemotaxis protein
VLIVDDNADSAELLGLLLERSRCTVKTVGDPFAALATALEFLPQVALIDIGLPGMDGIQLLKVMRAEQALSECRFIAVTGYSAHEINSRIDDTGFDAHVTKPIDFEMLYKAIGAELLASGY